MHTWTYSVQSQTMIIQFICCYYLFRKKLDGTETRIISASMKETIIHKHIMNMIIDGQIQ